MSASGLTRYRHRAEAEVPRQFSIDMTQLPRWLYLGTLAISNGGSKRAVTKLDITRPVPDEPRAEKRRAVYGFIRNI